MGYVFGPRLGAGGKCVISDEELQKIVRGKENSFHTRLKCARVVDGTIFAAAIRSNDLRVTATKQK
ncbi:MAG: hypothetical protein Ct9H300mP26_5050 [Acidimicrobiales bacterium]|nr:MAG: hypothetical protein Ct9H300mP26_5050 [Acidimicrobiales bacterium]